MGRIPRPVRIILLSVVGVVVGVLYYYIYGYMIPSIFSGYGFEVNAPKGVSVMVMLFILLGVFERVLPRIPAGAVRILSKVVGAVYLYYITSGGILSGEISGLSVTIDVSTIIYLVIGFSLVIGLLDAFSSLSPEIEDL